MYAVIRTGGKQYRVAPGDVIKVEKLAPEGGDFQFDDILAVSSDNGKISPAGDAKVSARVLGEGRGEKILVFHYKRKKQYKKLQGHRQPFTAVRIIEIAFDGQKFTAPEEAPKPKKETKAPPAEHEPREVAAEHKPQKKAAPKKHAAAKKAAPKATAHKKPASKKSGKPGKGKK